MRPPRLRCTLFSLIYPPHLLGSYKRQLYGFVLFSRLTKRNLASYVISVRRTKSSLTASFRFYLTIDTLAVQLYTSLSPRRVRDFHPLERAHGAQTKNSRSWFLRIHERLVVAYASYRLTLFAFRVKHISLLRTLLCLRNNCCYFNSRSVIHHTLNNSTNV